MKRDPLPAHVLATRLIPNVSPELAKQLSLNSDQKSLALITVDCDDVTYTSLDEATKKADCQVVYAKSFYRGAANANTALAGEIIGILAAPNPAEAKAGLDAAVDMRKWSLFSPLWAKALRNKLVKGAYYYVKYDAGTWND